LTPNNIIGGNIRGLIAGDFHFPFESEICVDLFLAFVKWFQPDFIVLNGDVADMYSISDHCKLKNEFIYSLQYEFDQIYDFLKRLRRIYDGPLDFNEGNHEFRLRKFMARDKRLQLRDLTISGQLNFRELHIKYNESAQGNGKCQKKNWLIMHGKKCSKHAGMTVINHSLDFRGFDIIVNHIHRHAYVHFTCMDKVVQLVENACMCDDPEYLDNPNWQRGFTAMVDSHAYPVRINQKVAKFVDHTFTWKRFKDKNKVIIT